jgi:hypothetical protein
MQQSLFPHAIVTSAMRNVEALGAVPLSHAVTSHRPYILVRSPDRCTVWAWPVVPSLIVEVALEESKTGVSNPHLRACQRPPA